MRSRQDKVDRKIHGSNLMDKRAEKKIAVIGAGMGGGKSLLHLSALGYKRFVLVDFDFVEETDIAKAPDVFSNSQVGMEKVRAVKETVEDKFRDVSIEAINTGFEASSLGEVDAVMDYTDDVTSKLSISEYCYLKNLPYTSGGIIGYRADLLVSPGSSKACLFCIPEYEELYYEEKERESEPDCQITEVEEGFLPTSNLTASFGVVVTCIEMDKLLLFGQERTTLTRAMIYPTPKLLKTTEVEKRRECPVCSPDG